MVDGARRYGPGQVIVREGEPGAEMFVILDGDVRVATAQAGTVTVLGRGAFFGEMAILEGGLRAATVAAGGAGAAVVPIDQARFVYMTSHQPAFALAVMAALSRRLRGAQGGTPTPSGDAAPPRADGGYTASEVKPGLWFLRSRGRAANAVLVAGRNRTVLVDTGLPSAFPSLTAALGAAGRHPADIDTVILTHEHADHVGGAGLLPGTAPVLAHPLAANKLRLGDDFATVNRLIGECIPPFAVDGALAEGSVVEADPYRFEVLHTPGHTSGCVCLLDRAAGVLISGDLVMAGGAMGGIFASGNLSDYVLSLRRLGDVCPGLALPGHGRAMSDPASDIADAAGRAEALLDETRDVFEVMSASLSFDQVLQSVKDLNRSGRSGGTGPAAL